MNKDFLWGGTSAANQYEGGYDVRKIMNSHFLVANGHLSLFKKAEPSSPA